MEWGGYIRTPGRNQPFPVESGGMDTYTLRQAAHRLDKSERTVRGMIASGKLTAEKVAGANCITGSFLNSMVLYSICN